MAAFAALRIGLARAMALAGLIALAACDISSLMPKEHVDFAKAVVMLVQNRDAEGLEAVSDPVLWQQLTPELRASMARNFPTQLPMTVNVVSYRSSSDSNVTNVSIVLRYVYPRSVVQAAVSFRSAEHGYVLTAINVMRGADGAPEQPTAETPRDM